MAKQDKHNKRLDPNEVGRRVQEELEKNRHEGRLSKRKPGSPFS